MSKQHDQITKFFDLIRSHILAVPALKDLTTLVETKTKIHVEYIALGIFLVLAIMLFSGFGAGMICHAAGFIYPFYGTIKALENSDQEEINFWLVYWVVYGFIGVTENFLSMILFWVPFFYPAKLAFTLWCYLPQWKGASTIYSVVILPLFKRHESRIDAALNNVDPQKMFNKKDE